MFTRLTLERASALGGWLGRSLGPRLPVSRRARDNLRRAFPDMEESEIERIVRGMWDNLGRVAAEYPHLGEIDCYTDGGRVEVVGTETLDRLRDEGTGCIFFGGHLANWELLPLAGVQRGVELTQVYRRANNPLVEDIPVPFFGRDAMTAPALAQLARRFQCPIVPARIERLGGVRFRLTVFPPLTVPKTDDADADAFATMREVNALLEGWIRERPEQWTWVHRRWPD